MICINDYKNLKIGDQIIIIPDIINLDNIGSYSDVYTLLTIKENYVSFSKIGGFNIDSVFSQTCFMYFREKNLNELLNK
jgi:stage III sporulation protein SpoIIIAA